VEACATSSCPMVDLELEGPMASRQIGNNALYLAASSDLVNQPSLTCVVCSVIVIIFALSNSPTTTLVSMQRSKPTVLQTCKSEPMSSAVWDLTPASNNAQTIYTLLSRIMICYDNQLQLVVITSYIKAAGSTH
jgi:hypothetical protein